MKKKTSMKIKINKKVIISLITLVIVITASWYYFSAQNLVAATVNGEIISEKRVEALYNSLPKENRADKKAILTRLIETKLLAQYAKDKGYYLSDTDFQKELDKRLEASNSTISGLVKELDLRGATLEDVRESIMIELFVNNIIAQTIQITDTEISSYRASTKSTSTNSTIKSLLLQQKTREVIAQIIQAEYKKATIVIEDKYK